MRVGLRRKQESPLRLLVHQDVIQRSIEEIAASPGSEVGGKFIGYLVTPSMAVRSETLEGARAHWRDLPSPAGTIAILGSISSGPGATRTASELLPDGEFQLRVFRELEQEYPEIEHLGSWHSHHPNGLQRFSSGDIGGYRDTVTSPDFNLDVFVAALCTNRQGLASGHFEVFLRTNPYHPLVIGSEAKVVTGADSMQPLIDRIERSLTERLTRQRQSTMILDRRLRSRFIVLDGPIEEHDAVSWILSERGASESRIAATFPRHRPDHAGVSMSLGDRDVRLSLDCSLGSSHEDIHGRVEEILLSLRDIALDQDE